MNRRHLLAGVASLAAAAPFASLGEEGVLAMHVLKDPGCGCCNAWIRILREQVLR